MASPHHQTPPTRQTRVGGRPAWSAIRHGGGQDIGVGWQPEPNTPMSSRRRCFADAKRLWFHGLRRGRKGGVEMAEETSGGIDPWWFRPLQNGERLGPVGEVGESCGDRS